MNHVDSTDCGRITATRKLHQSALALARDRKTIVGENSPYHQQSCKLRGSGVRVPEADFRGVWRLHFYEYAV